MKMKNMIALLTVLALLLCGAASAEEEPAVKTGIYTIINKTGENGLRCPTGRKAGARNPTPR